MPGTGFSYARINVILWAIFGPAILVVFGATALLTAIGASEWVTAVVAIPLMVAWIIAAFRFSSVPVDVALTQAGLRVRALRGWHPYRELDIDAVWPQVRSVLFGSHDPLGPNAWLLVRLAEPAVAFSLAGKTVDVKALEESILNAMPETDDEAARQLSESVSGRGFWTSHAATFITLGFAALWLVITGAGVMQILRRMQPGSPFPWLIWLVFTGLCLAWLRLYLAARKQR
jgi:hypothetical protein